MGNPTSPRRLAVFAHGSHAIGLGHLYRAARLMRAFAGCVPGSETLLVVKDDPEALSRAAAWDLRCHPVPRDASIEVLADAVERAVDAFRPDAVVHDALASRFPVMRALRRAAPFVVTLDDVSDAAELADLVVNVLYRQDGRPALPHEVQDPGWAVLDPAFTVARDRRGPARPDVRRILVTQGGSDTWGNLPRIATALSGVAPEAEVVLLAGPACRNRRELDDALARAGPRFRVARDVADVAGLMARSDLAVSGGGITLLELACAGVPTIALTGEARELETIRRLEPSGFPASLGLAAPFPAEPLAAAVDRLCGDAPARDRMSRAGRRLVDGRGIDRLTAALAGTPRGVVPAT